MGFLVLGIIAGCVAINQRKAINAQLDWSNTEARMTKAGQLKTAEHDLEDAKGADIRNTDRAISKIKEWIRCYDFDTTTRDAKQTYCRLKASIKEMELKNGDAEVKRDDDNQNAIAVAKAKIASLDHEM